MVHLRIVAPADRSQKALELLKAYGSVSNVIFLEGAATRPDGDVILCDVAREDASVVLGDLTRARDPALRLDRDRVHRHTHLRGRREGGEVRARRARGRGRLGAGRGEHVRERRAVRQLHRVHGPRRADRDGRDLPRLADPDHRRDGGRTRVRPARRAVRRAGRGARRARRCDRSRRLRSAFRWRSPPASWRPWRSRNSASLRTGSPWTTASSPSSSRTPTSSRSSSPSSPGTAGVLSLTSAKSGALIGVLISVTTIPAAANIGLAAAYGDGAEWRGAMASALGQPDDDRARRRRDAVRAAAALPAAPDKAPERPGTGEGRPAVGRSARSDGGAER